MAKSCHLENIIKQTRTTSNHRRITLKHTSGNNRKLYVNDNKVRLGQAIKQCTGLYQLAHFCIYYFVLS
jgi:hypothetical protein